MQNYTPIDSAQFTGLPECDAIAGYVLSGQAISCADIMPGFLPPASDAVRYFRNTDERHIEYPSAAALYAACDAATGVGQLTCTIVMPVQPNGLIPYMQFVYYTTIQFSE